MAVTQKWFRQSDKADGDPLATIQLIADPDKNLVVIMKDGGLPESLLSRQSAR